MMYDHTLVTFANYARQLYISVGVPVRGSVAIRGRDDRGSRSDTVRVATAGRLRSGGGRER